MAVSVQAAVREVMDIRQASEYLGISGDTLYRYASEGFIPAFKLGNRWRFKKSLLDAWMDEKSGVKPAAHADRGDAEAEEAGCAGAVDGLISRLAAHFQRIDGVIRSDCGRCLLVCDTALLVGWWESPGTAWRRG